MLSTHPIGMDIEQWSNKAWHVRDKFLTNAEFQLLPSYADNDTATILWSAKEAAFKLWKCTDLVVSQIRLCHEEKTHHLRGFVPGTDLNAYIKVHLYPFCVETEAFLATE